MNSADSNLTDPLVSGSESYDEENAAAAELTTKKRKMVGDADVAASSSSAAAAALSIELKVEEDDEDMKSVATTTTAATKDGNQVNRLQSKIARLTAELERVRKGEHHRTGRSNPAPSSSSLAAGRAASTAVATAAASSSPSQDPDAQNNDTLTTSAPCNNDNDNTAPSQLQPLETDPQPSYPNYNHPQQHPPHLRMWLLATYRLMICHNQTNGAPSRHWTLRKLIAIMAAFLLSILSAHEVIEEAHHHHHQHPHSSDNDDHPYYPPPGPQPEPLPPAMSRADHIASCAARLSSSDTFFSDITSSRMIAVEWFVIGAGRTFQDIPQTSAQCEDVNSNFATVYGLLVLRGALNVSLPTWNTPPEGLEFQSITDVCTHFHSVKCEQDKIISLNLSNDNITGTIPPEIGLMHSLQRIDLNNNGKLHGPIPSELGKLSNLQFLHLHSTALSGVVPSELGNLNQLKELFLEHNEHLSGTMPTSVCVLQKKKNGDDNNGEALVKIHADCGGDKPRIQCKEHECCTQCDKKSVVQP